jgi:hypothetical protein
MLLLLLMMMMMAMLLLLTAKLLLLLLAMLSDRPHTDATARRARVAQRRRPWLTPDSHSSPLNRTIRRDMQMQSDCAWRSCRLQHSDAACCCCRYLLAALLHPCNRRFVLYPPKAPRLHRRRRLSLPLLTTLWPAFGRETRAAANLK